MSRSLSAADQEARRRARLEEELLDEARIGHLSVDALDEIAYADRPPVHEGRLPPYGALIVPKPPEARTATSVRAVLDSIPRLAAADAPGDLRLYADGYSTFVVREEGREPWLGRLGPVGYSEREVMSLAEATRGLVVRRAASGQVVALIPGRVAWRSGGGWHWKPSSRQYSPAVKSHVPFGASSDLVDPILDLCVHSLSPLGVGCTIVWSLMRNGLDRVDHFDEAHAFQGPPLSVADWSLHPAIVSAVAQLDRAVVLDEYGVIRKFGVTLLDTGLQHEATTRGTRHDSAAAFSAGYRFLLVFVVSSDGPVTVYKEGRAIASTRLARRRGIESELCDCVLGQLDGSESFEERWNLADSLADPECGRCGGAGTLTYETNEDEPMDSVL